MSKRVYSTSLSFCHFHAARPDFGDDAMVLSGLCLACASSRAEELDVLRFTNCKLSCNLDFGSSMSRSPKAHGADHRLSLGNGADIETTMSTS